MAAADELVTILGVEVSKGTLQAIQSFKDGLDSVAAKMKTLSLVATGFAAAAGLMVKSAMDSVGSLQTMADKTGISTDALQEWAYAANQVGVSASAVHGDLAKFQQAMQWTGRGGDEQLNRFAEQLSGMSQPQAQAYGKAYGLSDDTIVLLRQGADGIARLRQEAHDLGAIIPEDQIKRSEEFRVSVTRMLEAFKGLRTHLAIAMMPALQRVTDLFTQFIVQNRAWLASKTEAFMNALVNAWEKIFTVIKRVLQIFQPLVDKFRELTGVMDDEEHITHVLQGAFAGLLLIFSPLIAKIAALSAAFYAGSLIVEDFMYWLNGDESLIGYGLLQFAEKFPGITKLFESMSAAAKSFFNGLIEWAAPIADAVGTAGMGIFSEISKTIDGLAATFSAWIDGFSERYPNLIKGFQAVASFLQSVFIAAIEKVSSVVQALVGWLGKLADMLGGALAKGLDWLNDKLGGLFGSEEKPKSGALQAAPIAAALPQAVPAAPQLARGATTNDNRTINIQATVGTPEQANQLLAPYTGTGGAQVNTPGLMAPAVG